MKNLAVGKPMRAEEVNEYLMNMNECLVQYHNMMRACKAPSYNGKITPTDADAVFAKIQRGSKPDRLGVLRSAIFNITLLMSNDNYDKDGVFADEPRLIQFAAVLMHMSETLFFISNEGNTKPRRFRMGDLQIDVDAVSYLSNPRIALSVYGGAKTAFDKTRDFLARVIHHAPCCLGFSPFSAHKILREFYAFVDHKSARQEENVDSVELARRNILLAALLINISFGGDNLYASVHACSHELKNVLSTSLDMLGKSECEVFASRLAAVYNSIKSAKPKNFFEVVDDVIGKITHLTAEISSNGGACAEEKSVLAACLRRLRDVSDVYTGKGAASASAEHTSFVSVGSHFGAEDDIYALYMHHMIDDRFIRTEVREVEVVREVPAPEPEPKSPPKREQRKRARPEPVKRPPLHDMSGYIPLTKFVIECVDDYMGRAFYNGYVGLNEKRYRDSIKRAFSTWLGRKYMRDVEKNGVLQEVFGGKAPIVSMPVMPDGRPSRKNTRYIPRGLLDALREDIVAVQGSVLLASVHSSMRTSHERFIDNHKADEPFVRHTKRSSEPSEFEKASIEAARLYNPVVDAAKSVKDDGDDEEEEEEPKPKRRRSFKKKRRLVIFDTSSDEEVDDILDDIHFLERSDTSDSIGAILRDSAGGALEDSNASVDFSEETRALLDKTADLFQQLSEATRQEEKSASSSSAAPAIEPEPAPELEPNLAIPVQSTGAGRKSAIIKYDERARGESPVLWDSHFTAKGDYIAADDVDSLNAHVTGRIRAATFGQTPSPMMKKIYDTCFAYQSTHVFYEDDESPECVLNKQDEQNLKIYMYEEHGVDLFRSNYCLLIDSVHYTPLFVQVTGFQQYGDLFWWYDVSEKGKFCRKIGSIFARTSDPVSAADRSAIRAWVSRVNKYGEPRIPTDADDISNRPPIKVLQRCMSAGCKRLTSLLCASDPDNKNTHPKYGAAICADHVNRCASANCNKVLCSTACIRFGVGRKFCLLCGARSY